MKKLHYILLAVLVLVGMAAAFVFKRAPGGEGLPSLKPYITKEKQFYYDPGELYKKMGLPSSSMPPGALEPMMMRLTRVSNIKFEELDKLMHRDLSPSKGWTFHPWPPPGMPKSSTATPAPFDKMIMATKGATGAPMSPFFTGIGTSDHGITAMPDFTNMSSTVFSSPTKMPEPKDFLLMEQKKLAKWEVVWLRVKNLGKNPFATEEQMQSMTDF